MSVSEQVEPIKFFMDNVPVVLFEGVKGGTGKTTICTNTANLLSETHKVGLLDADIDSPNLAVTLGLEGVMEQTADRYFVPAKYNDNLRVFSMTLFTGERGLAFTKRGRQNQNIISDALKYTNWGPTDFLLIDMPAGSGDEFRAVKALLGNVRGMVVVTLPNTNDDLMRCIDISSRYDIPIIGVVENMAKVICEECKHENLLYGLTGEKSKVELICEEYNMPYLVAPPYIPELHYTDEQDAFVLPSEEIGIIDKILEGIHGKEGHQDTTDIESS